MDLVEAVALADRLLQQHGLVGWRVELDRAKRRAGICRFGDRVIGLSAPLTLLHAEAEVRDTVLHEIAHALVGPRHGHDRVWRQAALRIGCSGTRCLTTEAPAPRGAWVGVCPAGHTKDRHRRPERVMTCGSCSRAFNLDHLLRWTHRGRPAAMHPNYEAELAALLSGQRAVRFPVGMRVRVTEAGHLQGVTGRISKVGRTRYHVTVPGGVLSVVFAAVEPLFS